MTDGELCPKCDSNRVYEGQWWHVVDEGDMHKVYQRASNGCKWKYLDDGLTSECCEECYKELNPMNCDYLKHLCFNYDTWGAVSCGGDPEHCSYCAEREGEEE